MKIHLCDYHRNRKSCDCHTWTAANIWTSRSMRVANVPSDQGHDYCGNLETAFLTIMLQKWWKKSCFRDCLRKIICIWDTKIRNWKGKYCFSTEIGKNIEHSRLTKVLTQRYSYESTLWIFLPLFPFLILEVNDIATDFLTHNYYHFLELIIHRSQPLAQSSYGFCSFCYFLFFNAKRIKVIYFNQSHLIYWKVYENNLIFSSSKSVALGSKDTFCILIFFAPLAQKTSFLFHISISVT